MLAGDPDNPLALEIRKEAVEAYLAACRKMVDALDTLKAFDDALASSTPNADQITHRSERLDQAAERVHFVLIQREAMKLPWYDHFFEDYGVPPEVIARLGRSRQK